ncbi:MAG: putative porin [Bacteroidales bacterium]|nr:putative porin [Bacteroidales bacterium]
MKKRLIIFLLAAIFIEICLPAPARVNGRSRFAPSRQDTTRVTPPALDSLSQPLDTVPPQPIDSAALRDSLAIDSLRQYYASMGLLDLDSLSVYEMDSCYTALYDSIFKNLPDTVDIRRAKRRIEREYRDSVRIATPRLLETFAVNDSLYYKRILMWNSEHNFNSMEIQKLDTLYNAHIYDYPFYRKDLGATYLGTTGSAAQHYNYFKREHLDVFPQFDPYLTWSYTPDNLPQFNTKTPYTQLAYEGTTFSLKAREESEIQLLTTQNITPAFNFTLAFNQYGAKGMLQKEQTDDRTGFVALNFLGKRYLANAGYIEQNVHRTENGGLTDPAWIRDTIVDTKEIDVNLSNASNTLKRRTVFLTHSLAIPMNFFRKNRDSLSMGEGTMAYIGHSGEYSTYKKVYTDQISSESDRRFYDNNFFINSSASNDSLSLTRFENRLFLKLQPFAPDAIVSNLNAGVGYQILSYYSFDPSFYLKGLSRDTRHNAYAYAGVTGSFRKYFAWDADGKYTFLGHNFSDLSLGGKVRFSVYPFDGGIHLTGKIRTDLTTPVPFQQKLNFNHHAWNNDFEKVSESRVEASLQIPRLNLDAGFGYALVDGMIYYDATSNIMQYDKPLSVMSAWAEENIKLWFLHFDNRVLFQISSNQEVLPLPKLAAHLRYYLQFTVVKNAMDMQIGMDGIWTSKFYEQGYMPDLGVFYNQNVEELGGTPYFDAFVNAQWQKVCVYVKYTNALLGWPQSDYFSAYQYIRPGRAFKFGVFWPF